MVGSSGDAGFSRRQPVRTASVPGDGVTRAPKPRKPRKAKGSTASPARVRRAPGRAPSPKRSAEPSGRKSSGSKSSGRKPSAATGTAATAPAKARAAKAAPSKQARSRKAPSGKGTSKQARTTKAPSKTATAKKAAAAKPRGSADDSSGSGAGRAKQPKGLPGYLVRPDTSGPKVRLGILWFLVAVGALVLGRWAVLGLWSALGATAAWQVAAAWRATPAGEDLPRWGPGAAAAAAAACTVSAGLGTGLGGVALIVAPLALVGAVALTGLKPSAAAPAVIGAVLAAVPTMSVVLVARAEQWAALFLVVAVSFFDAGNYIGAAESSSRLEGPVTGGIGLLAVTFAASAFEAAPFDRVTAWIGGAVMVLACPLGQMLVSAELPHPAARAPAMRRLDAYLLSAPLMFGAVWAFG